MSGFVKFPSIQQDWLVPAFSHNDFHRGQFVVSEKLDGANIQLYFEKSRPWRAGKRTGFVKRKQTFFNLWQVLDHYRTEIERLAKYAADEGIRLRVFGELFGTEVLRRIDYGTSGDLRFFQMDRNGVRLPFAQMEHLLSELDLAHLRVPVRCRGTFAEALALSPVFPSLLNPQEEAEGFVVCGLDDTFANSDGVPFLCKSKNPRFVDVEGGRADNPEYYPITAYLNRNRLYSVVSKHGDFVDPKKIDTYIQWVIDEVTDDYLRDHGTPPKVPADTFRHQIGVLVYEYIKARR